MGAGGRMIKTKTKSTNAYAKQLVDEALKQPLKEEPLTIAECYEVAGKFPFTVRSVNAIHDSRNPLRASGIVTTVLKFSSLGGFVTSHHPYSTDSGAICAGAISKYKRWLLVD